MSSQCNSRKIHFYPSRSTRETLDTVLCYRNLKFTCVGYVQFFNFSVSSLTNDCPVSVPLVVHKRNINKHKKQRAVPMFDLNLNEPWGNYVRTDSSDYTGKPINYTKLAFTVRDPCTFPCCLSVKRSLQRVSMGV